MWVHSLHRLPGSQLPILDAPQAGRGILIVASARQAGPSRDRHRPKAVRQDDAVPRPVSGLSLGQSRTTGHASRSSAIRAGSWPTLNALGADAGVSQPTARACLSVLETSFLCHRLSPWHRNVRKRTIKAPKLHLLDSGLMCFLLGIRSPTQLAAHPLRGAVFETCVVSEIDKARANAGQPVLLSHGR